MMNNFNQIDNDEMDNASFSSSEDSQEPYYHIETGKICSAREAWSVLAAEGHPRYFQHTHHGNNNKQQHRDRGGVGADSVFRTPTETIEAAAMAFPSNPTPPPPTLDDFDTIQQVSSFSGPTQSSIDRALHPESPNYISPNKDLASCYKKTSSYEGGIMDGPPSSDSDDEEDDPIMMRAKAMALAAQNGQKLTPAQMQLIAQPDVQQQKLILEAKRIQKAKEMQHHQQQKEQLLQQLAVAPENLKQMGVDFKKFIQTEKEKPALQWGADLGKFIESQSLRMTSTPGNANAGAGGENVVVERLEGGDGNNEDHDAATDSKSGSSPPVSPLKTKRKMEGFGTDPLAPRPSPGGSKTPTDPSSTEVAPHTSSSLVKGLSSKWPGMPPLPMLNDTIISILPGVGGNKGEASVESEEPAVRISGILWKRRSGFGKHSTINAWERRRVELKGSKLIYYRNQEEEEEEEDRSSKDAVDVAAAATTVDRNSSTDNASDGFDTPRDPPSGNEADGETSNQNEEPATSETITPNNNPTGLTSSTSSSKLRLSIFSQAAQLAEQRLQTATTQLSRLAASATGLESLKPTNPKTPRGILDLLKEHASVSVSMGHSGAPTPFCLSIKVKSETKWKFCFEGHGVLMEWMAALTDVLVGASVDVAAMKNEGSGCGGGWEMDDYCIRHQRQGGMEKHAGELDVDFSGNTALSAEKVVTATGTSQRSVVATSAVSGDGNETHWMILGTNLYIACAVANVALILARSSSTSIDQYWKLMVFTNFGIWQLCTRGPRVSSLLRSNESGGATTTGMNVKQPNNSRSVAFSESTTNIISARNSSYKPIAGNTTIQVTKVEDPNINKNGDALPSWVPISSQIMDVRSHGYLTTKKKIPSPGELYDCVAVDCFVSDTRFPEIAPRVRLPPGVNFTDGDGLTMSGSKKQPWKSPDVFIVSIAIPTEAPRFGQSTDDGPGLTIVGYFKMKEETRKILRRITAAGYDPSNTNDTLDTGMDVQKRIVNGVRLWERYCREAPNDPTFQARFKLIPSANLEELGCPSYISKYNGKPVLIKRNQVTGFFNDYPSLNVMEFDISLHPFPYLFKQAMSYIKDYFDKTVASFGFVIEGRNDDELPEMVIGALKVCYPDPKFIVSGEEFFAGTCPKSTAPNPT